MLFRSGKDTLRSVTTGSYNVAIGAYAGQSPNGVGANATITASHCVFIGPQSGQADTTQGSHHTAIGAYALAGGGYFATAIGALTSAPYRGSVAIGTDFGGAGAASTTNNQIMLGTSSMVTVAPGGLNVGAASVGVTGVGVFGMGNVSGAPSTPSGGGVLYADAGALKWRGSSGTVTTIAVA